VWGYAAGVQTRAVDFAIRRLRRKLEPDPAEPEVLQSVRGEGYRLAVAARSTPPPAPEPHPIPDLLGRGAELRTIRQLVDAGAGLVTLVGPGGVGKTTLGGRRPVEGDRG
jgi:hypothetical protein